MTKEARTFILKCFCKPLSAVETAYLVNRIAPRGQPVISAAEIRRIWRTEAETNIVLRNLEDMFGERPARGYAACEHTRLAEGLVAV